MQPQRLAEHVGQARVALERGALDRLRRGGAAEQVRDGRLVHLDLAQGGQHVADVGQEGPVRPDDEHARPAQPLPVREQQIGGPVKADRGLAGAGGALDADGTAEFGPDDDVLLRLDRRDDVAHRPGARPLDLLGEQPGRGEVATVQVLVLERGERAAPEPEAAPPGDAHRGARPGLVEGARDGRAPVQHEGGAFVIVDVPASDVDGFGKVGPVGVVEPTEEQRGVGVVGQGPDAQVEQGFEDLLGDPVSRRVGRQGRGVLPHPPQCLARAVQVGALGHERPRYVGLSGHASAPCQDPGELSRLLAHSGEGERIKPVVL
ncbi:hypothetical protein [Actinocorallia sp. API 0066]|uniref:hypothetical protein n=1 Tax=Actinocorallia sp. API 0066 TaxID=2896846 RepID=UPI0027DF4BE0|nr:hypothetical protein [Actinocorallia sp. API 0066]